VAQVVMLRLWEGFDFAPTIMDNGRARVFRNRAIPMDGLKYG